MKRAVRIEIDGYVRSRYIRDDTDVQDIESAIGGHMELVRHNVPNLIAFMDDQGRWKRLAPNPFASRLLLGPDYDPQNTLVGPVLVMGKTPEGEIEGLTDEQLEIFLSRSPDKILDAFAGLSE